MSASRQHRIAFAITSVIAAAGVASQEARNTPADQRDREGAWQIILGAGARQVPDYEGSDDSRARAHPVFLLDYRDLVFLRGGDLGANLVRLGTGERRFRAGPLLRFDGRFHREEDDNAALRGLGEIDEAFEAGLFASFASGPWSVSLDVAKDVSNTHDGMSARLEAGHQFTLTPRLSAVVQASAMWADDNYVETLFGITPMQSLNSGLRAYQPDGGIKHASLSFNVRYSVSRSWFIGAGVEYKKLLGDVADSPLVADLGSDEQVSGGAFLAYVF
jgi:outer membrane protein